MHTEQPFTLLLADDDQDDCNLFQDALNELQLDVRLECVHNGEQLMILLHQSDYPLPDVLFLDLNMPRKNGFQCLSEIKQDERLQSIPVMIFSTSFQKEMARLLHKYGAHQYIQKPSDFHQFKKVIHLAISLLMNNSAPATLENFVLSPETNGLY